MQNAFGTQAQKSIQPALQQDKSLGTLSAQLILAKKAKDSGNKMEYAKNMIQFDYMLKQQKLDDQKAHLTKDQKQFEERQKLNAKLLELGDEKELISKYLENVKKGDTKSAIAYLALIDGANPQMAKYLGAIGNKLYEQAEHGVSEDVQKNTYYDQNKEDLNNETIQETIRRKEITGQDLLDSEDVLKTNELGGNIDPTEAGEVKFGLRPDANTMAQIKSDEAIAREKGIPKEQHLVNFVNENYEALGLTKDRAVQLNKQILQGEVNELDLIEQIHLLEKPPDVTELEWLKTQNESIRNIVGAVNKSARATDTAEAQRIVRSYPSDGPIQSVFRFIQDSFSEGIQDRQIASIDHLMQGKSWEEVSATTRKTVAQTARNKVDAKPPNKAYADAFEARRYLQENVPNLIRLMIDYEKKYPNEPLGVKVRWYNKAWQAFTDRSGNKEQEEIRSAVALIVKDAVKLASGAAASDSERAAVANTLPSADIELKFSIARAKALLDALPDGARRNYSKLLHPKIAEQIVKDSFTQPQQEINDIIFIRNLSEQDKAIMNNLTDAQLKWVDTMMKQGKAEGEAPETTRRKIIEIIKEESSAN